MNDLLLDWPEPGIAVLQLNRPQRLNALTDDSVRQMSAMLDALATDAELRVLILTGAGRGFCAGFDLSLATEAPLTQQLGEAGAWTARQEAFAGIVTRLRALRVPVIAAVNGPAHGAGLGIALACEIRLAAPEASFSAAFVKVGMSSCDIGVSWLLPRCVGMSRAFEIMLTGRSVAADEADRIGLVSRVLPSAQLLDEALAMARSIAAHSAFGVWMTKRGAWANVEAGSLQAALELENRTQILARSTGELARAAARHQQARHADARAQAVEQFYDFHPISAQQIFDAVAARGIAPGQITEAVLAQHDQDHYGGTAAVDRLMAQAGVTADDQVLDVCSGMGGPARYLAWKAGCDVTGLDLTASRVAGACALTAAARLADRVRFVQGNALAMPFADASFSLAIGQEAFAHIPDKPRLVAECARVLRPGGRLVFSDILSRGSLSDDDAARLYDGMRFSEIASVASYSAWLQQSGLQVVQVLDLTEEWTRILVDRHAMYRSLQAQTVARLGQAHFDRYDQAYAHFVGLYRSGVLAGALIHACKPSGAA